MPVTSGYEQSDKKKNNRKQEKKRKEGERRRKKRSGEVETYNKLVMGGSWSAGALRGVGADDITC